MLMLTVCGAKVRCPEDFTYDEPTEMCFKLYVEDKVTFEQAELSCLRYDSGIRTHLAMVDTEEKRLMLAHHIEPEPQSMREYMCRIGIAITHEQKKLPSLSYTCQINYS